MIAILDIDECLTYGQCSQGCVNFKGGHKCTCQPGYELEPDHKTCRAKGRSIDGGDSDSGDGDDSDSGDDDDHGNDGNDNNNNK